VAREYPTQCWSCLGEFDAASAIWCACSAKSATKLCPFCFHCFCQADAEYREGFWKNAPHELKEESDLLKEAAGSSGEALIRSNLLSTDQLVAALRWQQNRGGALEDALVDLGFVARDNLELVMKRQPPTPGTTMDLSKGLVDASLVKTVTVEVCYRKKILPISKEEIGEKSILTLAMAGPTDVETIDQVQSLTNCRVIPMNVSEKDIFDRLADLFPVEFAALQAGGAPAGGSAAGPAAGAPPPAPVPPVQASAPPVAPAATRPAPRAERIKRSQASGRQAAAKPLDEVLEDIEERPETETAAVPSPDQDLLAVDPSPLAATPSPPPSAIVPETATAPAQAAGDETQVLQAILAEAISKRTSLVQFEIRGAALSLFFRIDGNLFRAKPSAQATATGLQRALNTVAALPQGDRPAAGRLAVKMGDRKIEVVVRRFHSAGGTSFLLKIIERSDFLRTTADLGPSALDLERIRQALALPHGLVVLSAPPHNGLETTRYSLMAHLASERRRVLSIDSPQLLAIPEIRQEEAGFPPDAANCRATVGAVPGCEVVLLPEIQGSEMAALALETAATCLVVACIQARRASQTPAALLWHQVDAGTLASRLKLIVNQRLVRRICEACRKPSPVTDRVLKMMGLTPDESLDLKVHQGSGCGACGPLSPGYAGRVALVEVLAGTPEIAALVAAGGSQGEIEREARRAGMSPLRAGCLARVGQGVTTLEEFQKGNF
jgi:type II secretory ATPase GspE/PulE/Tfp pilus assembly ATPase PilB-like protein